MQADQTIVVDDIDEALCETLLQIVDRGSRIVVGGKLSIAAGKTTCEILNYNIRIIDPKRRFPRNSGFHFSAVAAVARFVWMMSGSDRVSDIAFYQPRAAAFSDDGLTIPGSCYGKRFISTRPGLNQLMGAIDRLKEDPNSRRAFLSIYHPEDAVRPSKDIPCLLSLGYHIRDGKLCASTFMRANNAYSLFPYNFFEFSLLAEVIAVELGVGLGPLTHSVTSMHIYEEEVERAREVIRASVSRDEHVLISVPPNPLAGIRNLIDLEPRVRAAGDYEETKLKQLLEEGRQKLDGVWRDMFLVLIVHTLLAAKKNHEAGEVMQELAVPWPRYMPAIL